MGVRGARIRRFRSRSYGKVIPLAVLALIGWRVYVARDQTIEPVSADTHVDLVEIDHSSMPVIPQTEHSYTVADGDVLADVFAGFEIPYPEIVRLQQESEAVFSLTGIRPGKSVSFSVAPAESAFRLAHVVYQPDANRVIVATQNEAGWIVLEEKIEYHLKTVAKAGTVEQSLYVSALNQGLDEKIIMQIADTFAWDIDFARDTANGDSYKVLYEEKYLEGVLVTTGRVLAAEYTNKGKAFQAFLFQPEGEQIAYYTADGKALQRAFLKAPVNFRYVTSGFSNARFHPVLGKVLPHDGIDYAAAYGTPIIAIGDGVVSRSAYAGGYGNRIEIRHNERYGSQYSHMSSYVKGLNVGDRVKQGQTIGYVGSTGFSTGNHVHFSMTEYGAYVDPALVDAPDGEALAEEFLEAFSVSVADWQAQLNNLTP